VPALRALQQHRELIAAQPRHHVLGAGHRYDALGHLHQHAVAGGMADAVVDQLEAVQVEEQHGEHRPALALGQRQRILQAIEQVQAVGQAGQRIVHGLMGQALLGTQALADLPEQLFVDLGQLAGAFLHALFQLGMRRTQPLLVALARQPGSDVLRNEGQQALIVHAERAVLAVALHHDRADHLVVAQQRHAQPAMRARAGFAHFAAGQQRVDLRREASSGRRLRTTYSVRPRLNGRGARLALCSSTE
jgi:hypothetical protein